MDEYTVKKSVCERYDLRFRHEWAFFTIDENSGLFSCSSSYGVYAYNWPNHGRKTFKHFLIEIARSPDYLLRKVSDDKYFDFDKCLRNWKKEIIKLRKNISWSNEFLLKEDARELWDFIEDLDSGMSCDYIQRQLYDHEIINKICGSEPWYMFETDKTYPPDAVIFANEVMPMFADFLKKEIANVEDKTA